MSPPLCALFVVNCGWSTDYTRWHKLIAVVTPIIMEHIHIIVIYLSYRKVRHMLEENQSVNDTKAHP